jgi:hypothetical protein
MSKLHEKPSAFKREHRSLQKIKFINFFLCLWVIFALLDSDTDPGTPLNADSMRIPVRIHNTDFYVYGTLTVLSDLQCVMLTGLG